MTPMQEEIFKENLKKAKLYKRQMTNLIGTFTQNNITSVVQKDSCNGRLANITDNFVKVSNWFML
jgi:hypothetical protein